jgi:hypothetical protein
VKLCSSEVSQKPCSFGILCNAADSCEAIITCIMSSVVMKQQRGWLVGSFDGSMSSAAHG